ncbi:hypothetical protein BLNAU_2000 [Blattamonas nauphoetae]|uniref:Uncharacterized protein n=1 Tax=Blattamonas nauphoetae TaxID=2049346 RepID=A0ABQ9YGU3_9EUKA|nr:hypothetical protein BLNAU_2000 [Blattamonas nauphoetae]
MPQYDLLQNSVILPQFGKTKTYGTPGNQQNTQIQITLDACVVQSVDRPLVKFEDAEKMMDMINVLTGRPYLATLLPHEVAMRPVPSCQSLELMLSSCSKALNTHISVHSTALSLYPLYQALVNIMYHNPALRVICLPKCLEILEYLAGKLEDERIHVDKLFTRLYPSPDGSLDPFFNSLTLIEQLSTPSQMKTILRFYFSFGGLAWNPKYKLTSHAWFAPFFLRIVDFGINYADRDEQERIFGDVSECLQLDFYFFPRHPVKYKLAQYIVSYNDNRWNLFTQLRRTFYQTEMTPLKWSVLKLIDLYRRACELLKIKSTLFSVKADNIYLTLAMLDSNDEFRQHIRRYAFELSRRKSHKRALQSAGWEDALELQTTYRPFNRFFDFKERPEFIEVVRSLGCTLIP